ncbi:MAG: hypothetical protein M3Z46_13345 [Actinomycetota bacterium]|nr:hypothetical protein [Actinomycetota bacterium]
MRWKTLTALAFGTAMVCGATAGPVAADPGPHMVRDNTLHDGYPNPPQETDNGWYREDTQVGGGVTLTSNFGAPSGFGGGALALTTNDQSSAKAQLNTRDDVYGEPLFQFTNFLYQTWHSATGSTTFPDADASYQVRVDIDGNLSTTGDQTNLVYEPYWNDIEGPAPQHPEGIKADTWQSWDATRGDWWSSKQIGSPPPTNPMDPPVVDPNCGLFHVEPGGGGPPFTQPSAVAAGCPKAKVVFVGVSVGSYNPSYVVAVDDLQFTRGADVYSFNFEPGTK